MSVKEYSKLDSSQTLKAAFNDATGTLKVISGFLLSAVNREIDVAYPTSTTETYTYKESDGSTLFVITLTYADSTKAQLSSAKRTS